MLRSLYSGVSGLKTHQQKMDVIGNNIANVNTYGYKSSRVTFQDVYYQTLRSASGGTTVSGGINASQIGYGVQLGSIDTMMSRSGFQMTSSGLDMAIAGEGFFQVQDQSGNIMYTRAGILEIDNNGALVDVNGNFVLGITGNPSGQAASSNKIQVIVPNVTDNAASATKTLLGSNVTVSAELIGAAGNISINFVHGKPSTAELSGNNLTVTFDQTKQYNSLAELEAEIHAAITQGGVELEIGRLQFEVDPYPGNTLAAASNTLTTSSGALNFEMVTAGSFGNSVSVAFKSDSTATDVTAKWNDGVLTFTVPETMDDGSGGTIPFEPTVAQLQAAADAANMNNDPADPSYSAQREIRITGDDNIPITDIISTGTVKLMGGDNTYFTNIAGLLGTVKLDGGRTAAAQSVSDLTSMSIAPDGVITATHPVHGTLILGRIDIVTFDNPNGLEQAGNTYFTSTSASGEASLCEPGQNGSGELVTGALEMSNVDLAQEFADMITTQRGFQANSRIITTSDEMLQELVNLKR
ncbi:MAG: flagellar hook-basal body complex protein [Clostridiales bacterium]|nr:flagellar hook-basal body complex protein [Clostridiales bacterium]